MSATRRTAPRSGKSSSSSRSHHGRTDEFEMAFSPERRSGKIRDAPLEPARPGTNTTGNSRPLAWWMVMSRTASRSVGWASATSSSDSSRRRRYSTKAGRPGSPSTGEELQPGHHVDHLGAVEEAAGADHVDRDRALLEGGGDGGDQSALPAQHRVLAPRRPAGGDVAGDGGGLVGVVGGEEALDGRVGDGFGGPQDLGPGLAHLGLDAVGQLDEPAPGTERDLQRLCGDGREVLLEAKDVGG